MRRRIAAHECLPLFVASALLLLSQSTSALEPNESALERGKLLVANEALNDPNFDSSVVLIVSHGNLGTLGLIVNRRYESPDAIHLPEPYQALFADTAPYFGGPVPADGLRALVISEFTIPGAIHIKDELYFVDNPGAFDYLREERESAQAMRIYEGIASWIPGQLAAEVRAGAWYVLDGQQSQVFSENEKLWEELIAIIHAKWVERTDPAETQFHTELLLLPLTRHSIMPTTNVANAGSFQAIPSLNGTLAADTP